MPAGNRLNAVDASVCCPGAAPAAAHSPFFPSQVVGLLRGRPTADAPGDGHCSIVLSVDAAMEAGRQFIASGGHHGDGAVKVWAHDSVGGGSGGPSPMDAS